MINPLTKEIVEVGQPTGGEWRLVYDAQGPCMVLHPTREGVAIASLTQTFMPAAGFHDDWDSSNPDAPVTVGERNANVYLVAAAPALLEALLDLVTLYETSPGRDPTFVRKGRHAIDKALGHERAADA